MQLNPSKLDAHLHKGLGSLYTLHGDEPLLILEAQDAIRAAARSRGFTERSSHTVSGAYFDWSEILAAAGSVSLFADKQILEVSIPTGKPGKEGGVALQRLAKQTLGSDSILTMVTLPRLDKTTKGSNWFAALEAGMTLEVASVDRSALPQWIAQRMAAQGQRVATGIEGQQTLQFFTDQVEGNLLAAHQEIQKLALLFAPGELSQSQIESAVQNVARYDVFKLTESVLSGQYERMLRMLSGLQAEDCSAVLVHYTLAEDIRALKRVKAAISQGRPLPVALREQHIWGTKERLFERVLPRLSDAALAALLQSAHQVDGIVKGLKQPDWPDDPWQALQRLAFDLCRQCAPAMGKGQR